MATMFHERERAFEAKFAHDEEFRFLVGARRDRLFAEWAAEMLGLSREEGDALVKSVHRIPNGSGHDQALLQVHIRCLISTPRRNLSRRRIRCSRAMRGRRTPASPEPHPVYLKARLMVQILL